MSFSANKTGTREEVEQALTESVNTPTLVREAVGKAIDALPKRDDKVIQMSCYGHIDEGNPDSTDNVVVNVSLVNKPKVINEPLVKPEGDLLPTDPPEPATEA
jgi:hypothetical protein